MPDSWDPPHVNRFKRKLTGTLTFFVGRDKNHEVNLTVCLVPST